MRFLCQYRLLTAAMLYGCFFLLLSVPSFGQSRYDWKSRIDYLVDEIDSLAMKTQRTFIVTKYLKNDDPYKETWHYTMKDGKVVYFEIRYVIGQDEFTEIYYVYRNQPICMEQYEAPFMAYYIDELKQGKMFFIDDNTVKLYVTLGKKQVHSDFPNAEVSCLQRFENRFTELKKTMQYLE